MSTSSPPSLTPQTPQQTELLPRIGSDLEATPDPGARPLGGHTHLLELALLVQLVDVGQQGPPVCVLQLEDADQRLHKTQGALSQEPGRTGLQWPQSQAALEAQDLASAGGDLARGLVRGGQGPEVGTSLREMSGLEGQTHRPTCNGRS